MLDWIALALLSVSWLPGLGYYHGAEGIAWIVIVPAGTFLLGAGRARARSVAGTVSTGLRRVRLPAWKTLAAALAMIVPAVWLMPWPYRAAPGLMAIGLVFGLAAAVRIPMRRWLGVATRTCLLSGCVLLAQSLAMIGYAVATSRSHLLPSPLPQIVAAAVKALGIDSSVYGTTVAVFSMRKNHLFTATWELLLDPPTWCFVIGAAVLLWWKARLDASSNGRLRSWLQPLLKLYLLVALWLPFRAALLIAIYLDSALRTDYDSPLDSMKLFWSAWVLLAMLIVPVLLAWRFARTTTRQSSQSVVDERGRARKPIRQSAAWHRPASVALAAAAAALAGLGIFWDPVGQRKAGRVLIEEKQGENPVWEPTDKPYDTERYGSNSAYTYYCVFNYYTHYYDIARLARPIDDDVLADCDVLILKIPTREYSDAEVDAIVRFVHRGGGLMMIGEHTDVFGSGTHLNQVAEHFGFSYRFDCLFGIDSVFQEHFDIPLVPHPILQYMPTFDFAISCSIDPGTSGGHAVIRNAGLKNLPADYHADNFYPHPDDSAEMEYGAFTQLWAMRYGEGRIAAFTDSTVFSDFCTFEPGKSELMMGMLEWLNHQGGPKYSREWLLGAAAIALLLALWMARGWNAAWLLLVAGGLLGWSASVWGSNALHHYEMPRPAPQRPLVEIVVDRTLCDGPLSDAGFVGGKENGFGIFERWMLRLGYFTARRDAMEDAARYFQGDAIVLCCPHLPLPRGFRERMVEYVRNGGKLLVLDSADRSVVLPGSDPLAVASAASASPQVDTSSTAGFLLEPFGMMIDVADPLSGDLDSHGKWPAVPIAKAAAVSGGEPLAWVQGRPVAARCDFGKGSVTVIGFGSRFNDANMGIFGDVVPDDALKAVYAIEFSLVREIIDGKHEIETNKDGKRPNGNEKKP